MGSESYQIGYATASSPLGPWTKSPNNPVVKVGASGAWDNGYVASPNVLQHPNGSWLMYYEGQTPCAVGLATSDTPVGPWTKYPGNPITQSSAAKDPSLPPPWNTADNGFYVASVMHYGGEFRMYVEGPIDGPTCFDQGPLALWTSPVAEGPFEFKDYVLMPGAFNGSGWDRCGYSESKVLFDEKGGLFHVFASGATGVQCAYSSNTCDAAWHCSTCKRGANNPTDCLTCPPGFTLADECSDCTGSCVANATANGALLPGQANALTNTSTSVCEAKDRAAREEAAAQGARLLPGRGAKGGRGRRRADRLDKIRAAGYGGGFYEHLGYAVSTDGIHFTQSEHNPVAAPGASTPFTAAMAEAHVFLEDPLVYVYHTSECACPSCGWACVWCSEWLCEVLPIADRSRCQPAREGTRGRHGPAPPPTQHTHRRTRTRARMRTPHSLT